MNMNSINGNDSNGNAITIKVGDKVRCVRLGNTNDVVDVVRACFDQHDTVNPNSYPAVVLTDHSWTPLSNVVEVL